MTGSISHIDSCEYIATRAGITDRVDPTDDTYVLSHSCTNVLIITYGNKDSGFPHLLAMSDSIMLHSQRTQQRFTHRVTQFTQQHHLKHIYLHLYSTINLPK